MYNFAGSVVFSYIVCSLLYVTFELPLARLVQTLPFTADAVANQDSLEMQRHTLSGRQSLRWFQSCTTTTYAWVTDISWSHYLLYFISVMCLKLTKLACRMHVVMAATVFSFTKLTGFELKIHARNIVICDKCSDFEMFWTQRHTNIRFLSR